MSHWIWHKFIVFDPSNLKVEIQSQEVALSVANSSTCFRFDEINAYKFCVTILKVKIVLSM